MYKEKITKIINRKNLLIATTLVLVLAQVAVTLETVTSGALYSSLEKERQELAMKKSELNSQLIRRSSLTSAEERSEELGFTKSVNVVYLTTKDPIAQLR